MELPLIESGSIEITGLGLERGDDKCSLDIVPNPVRHTPQDLLIATCPQALVTCPIRISSCNHKCHTKKLKNFAQTSVN